MVGTQEQRLPNDTFHVYQVSKYGDILAFSAGEGEPRCKATFKRGTNCEPFFREWDAIRFEVGDKDFTLPVTPINSFKDGYPTDDKRGELYTYNGQLCATLFADAATDPGKLILQTMKVVPFGHVLSVSVKGERYELTCPGQQYNMAGDSYPKDGGAPEPYHVGTLGYHVDVICNNDKAREFDMEQSLSSTGTKVLSIYGAAEEDLGAALLMARIVTLTGFPSNAKPIEVVTPGK